MSEIDQHISTDEQVVWQFSTTDAWQSHLIRIMTQSQFSHVDMVLPEGLLGASDSAAPVVAGNPHGVAIRPFDYEVFKTRRRAVIKTDKAKAIQDRWRSQLGKPFDKGALTAFLHVDHYRDWRDDGMWFCAEGACWTHEQEAFFPYKVIPSLSAISPQGLLLLFNPYLDTDIFAVEVVA